MGLRDVLFGKKKLSEPREDRLFALSTACVTLETELGLKPAGAAAVAFKPLSSGDFTRVADDVQSLVDAVARGSGSAVERKRDEYGFEWVIVRDEDFEDVVAGVHAVAQGLTEQGFGPQLLAAAFRFDGAASPVYWIYGFKRGAFWPFVPKRESQERDNAEELELKAKLEGELPIEQDLSRWFALFGAPV
jgi:hypothetical protein